MIRVIRDDGTEILLNTDIILDVTTGPEKNARIHLSNGEILDVKTPVFDVITKIKAYWAGYKQEVREFENPGGDKKDKDRKQKDRDKDRDQSRDKDKDKNKDKDRDQSRDKSKDRDKDKFRSGGRDSKRSSPRDKDRSRDRRSGSEKGSRS
jgi:uncharacterized protein YlzI (FlbEa/FlbD family)